MYLVREGEFCERSLLWTHQEECQADMYQIVRLIVQMKFLVLKSNISTNFIPVMYQPSLRAKCYFDFLLVCTPP